MKAFTDIEQSKMLEAILPLESADMHYSTWTILEDGEFIVSPNEGQTIEELQEDYGNQIIPCWSLAALADILRKEFEVCIIGYEKAWKCHITNRKTLVTDWLLADNPIDACYGMILKLHEQKLL